jgi:hypothetical protein
VVEDMDKKKIYLALIPVFTFLLFTYYECNAEEYKKNENVSVPSNMEIIKEGDVNVLLPKGSQLQKDSSFLITEPPDGYAARKFLEIEGYIMDLKKEIETQKEELSRLKDAVEAMHQKKDSNPPGSTE